MGKLIDLTGKKFGRLTVIERRGSDKYGKVLWLCKCDCGNETVVRGNSLKRGLTTSCGCYKSDKKKEQMKEMWKDEDFRQMKSDGMRERWQNEDFRQMRTEQRRRMNEEMWQDEERRRMQSEQMSKMVKEKWQDEEFRQMQSDKAKEQWEDENMKWKMGYKGGITPISKYLRNLPIVEQWLNDCKQQVNYTCELTGKVGVKLHTHHLKAFNTIVLEAHKLNNIEIHEIVGEYTQEELYKLEEYVVSYHQDNSNAVVLCKEMHDLFHNIYGYGNNTKEQYIEFKERKQRGDI